LIIANIAVFVAQIFIVREERYSLLAEMRKQNSKLDKLLTEKGDSPEALEEIKRDHKELKEIIEAEGRDSVFEPGRKVSLVQEWFELDTRKLLRGQVWRLLTHAFCHERAGIWHILFNMLFLYWWAARSSRCTARASSCSFT